MITPQQENIIKSVTQRVKPTLVGVFGSYARGEENEKSDLDILIDFDMKVNLLDLIGIEQELSELLGIKVDLITLRSVNTYLKQHIEADLIRLVWKKIPSYVWGVVENIVPTLDTQIQDILKKEKGVS